MQTNLGALILPRVIPNQGTAYFFGIKGLNVLISLPSNPTLVKGNLSLSIIYPPCDWFQTYFEDHTLLSFYFVKEERRKTLGRVFIYRIKMAEDKRTMVIPIRPC